jgi:predicted LPLAT superfamily acyltransferase
MSLTATSDVPTRGVVLERDPRPLHAPTTGRLRKWLGPFYFTGVFWYRFHLFGVRVLPDVLLGPAIRLFTGVFFVALGRVRRAVASNLEHVLGPCGFVERQRRVWRTLSTFAWCVSERYEQFVPGRDFEAPLEDAEAWSDLVEGERGFVLVTAHVGNWEVASTSSVSWAGRRCHVVRERELDPGASRFVQELLESRAESGCRTCFAGDDPRLALELGEALRDGDMVALQGDRPRAGSRSIETEVCGMRFPLPVGPAILARAANVPIVAAFIFRTGRRKYRVVVRDRIEVRRDGDRNTAVEEAVHALAAQLEWAIRHSPNEWFCFTALEPVARDADGARG